MNKTLNIVEQPASCPRCKREPLRFRVCSDLMDIEVCESCGLAALTLGLKVTRLAEPRRSSEGPAGPYRRIKEGGGF